MVPLDLVALGLNAVDVLVRLPEQIRRDDKQRVDEMLIQGGAPTGSGACGVARLGYEVAYVARIGRDPLSRTCEEEFRASEVATNLLIHDAASRPALALVEIDPASGARTVFIQMQQYGFLRPADIPVATLRSARTLLLDSYDLAATEIALLAVQGTECRTVLDFESGDREQLRTLISLSTDPILPLSGARLITAQSDPAATVKALAEMTSGQAIVTHGVQGSWAWDRALNAVRHQPAFPVASRDTTGCGDAYHAGYIVGLLENWPLPIRMEFAALLAARVATRIGGRSALPWRRELLQLVRPDVSPELVAQIRNLYARSPADPR
jgi:sulfofructose kinase